VLRLGNSEQGVTEIMAVAEHVNSMAVLAEGFRLRPTDIAGHDNWRVRLAMARLWVDAVNRHGGDARLVYLPDLGIRGNTHFLYSDLNNLQIADQMSTFLAEKGLD